MLTPSDKALVPFVSVDHMMQLIHHIGIEDALKGLAAYIEADFRRWELFDKSPRVASHSPEGVIELMPTSDGEVYGFKYVNGHPKNTADGLQTVTAFGLLADVATGYPVLLSEMTMLTAMRTAATSALVARVLAPKGATTMAMIGNGAQSEFQSIAMKAIVGINTVRLYDVDTKATAKCAANLANSGLTVVSCDSAQEAIEGAQILTTCTADKQYATILTDNMVGSRRAHQRHRRRLSGQDGTGPGHPDAVGHLCGIPGPDPDRGRDPAACPRPPGHRILGGSERRQTGAHVAIADHPVRQRGLCHRRFQRPALRARPDRGDGLLPSAGFAGRPR